MWDTTGFNSAGEVARGNEKYLPLLRFQDLVLAWSWRGRPLQDVYIDVYIYAYKRSSVLACAKRGLTGTTGKNFVGRLRAFFAASRTFKDSLLTAHVLYETLIEWIMRHGAQLCGISLENALMSDRRKPLSAQIIFFAPLVLSLAVVIILAIRNPSVCALSEKVKLSIVIDV